MEATREVELKSITIKFTPGELDVMRFVILRQLATYSAGDLIVLQQFLAITSNGGR